jgi:outer membrane lipoprotein-sorting protein
VRQHLEGCPECRVRFEQEQRAFDAIRPAQRIVASQHFKEGAMKTIIAEAERESARSGHSRNWRYWSRWAAVAAAAILLFLLFPVLRIDKLGNSRTAGNALLAQSVGALSNVQTVHMIGRMRTLPGDNFELIGANYGFVPLELWREYSNPPRWRVEKTGRVVVMDGQSSTLYISKNNMAMTATPTAGFVEWLRPLLDPESILQQEVAAGQAGKAKTEVTESNGTLTLSVRRSANGNFANDWSMNKSIPESDHTRIYEFDSGTKRLNGLQVIVHTGDADVTVLEITSITYNEAFPLNLFTLLLPSDVNWIVNPAQINPPAAGLDGPKQAATFFFDALARKDWDAVLQVYPVSSVSDKLKQYYGGLGVVSIGEPFKSGLYPGYFVPYEVRLPSGSNKKFKLAVRNDNPAANWVVDGGF